MSKGSFESITITSSPISADDLVGAILDSLHSNYRPFVRSIEVRLQPVSFDDLLGLLLLEEKQLMKLETSKVSLPSTALLVSRDQLRSSPSSRTHRVGHRGGQYLRGGRSYQSPALNTSNTSQFVSFVTCYNCNETGYISR